MNWRLAVKDPLSLAQRTNTRSVHQNEILRMLWSSIVYYYSFIVIVWFQWEPVEYFDNKIICDLVEAKPYGIIALMVNKINCSSNKLFDLYYEANLINQTVLT
jgi:hypothetical protein